ncbi:tRNA dihydrouridine(20/20a) synthase DusA [Flocculibacter collagenilyticus]|uniref:tRNA dihydrouridine(20/20a) synthase DusA n=1 Tax=Flocculibacter collagenilyticus TaxID=2744479 RepID=UPI0018F3CC4E|nr:tRNA dihydrouridine(20/20a) synthase DusA [Flocculibacter collagenilyticus]
MNTKDTVKQGATPLKTSNSLDRKISIAPMLDWTDKNCRYFHRVLTSHAVLYTEMVTTGAILFGKGDYLAFNEEEHPVALQLGGSDPEALAKCAVIAQERGYDEINLNVGCPSDRVQNGRFGACLMAEPALVADCISAMNSVVKIPVTLKTRIGIDEQDSYEFLCTLIESTANIGCDTFIIHARKAWLNGLSPKENRTIPPLDYDRVYQLKKDYPHLSFSLNGGVTCLQDSLDHLQHVDGVMIGREAYSNPYLLSQIDHKIYGGEQNAMSRVEVAEAMFGYIERHISQGGSVWQVARHMLGLFQGQPGARGWRRHLSENANKPGANVTVIEDALNFVRN